MSGFNSRGCSPGIRRGPFREWLMGEAPDAPVGTTREPYACPIAQFLSIKTGGLRASVDDTTYQTGVSGSRTLPAWAADFVGRVDRTGMGPYPITAAEALEILEAIP